MNMFTLLILAIAAMPSSMASTITIQPAYGQAVAECKTPAAGSRHVWIFKQWHADPGIDTHDRAKAKALPQAPNQTAIFRQLDSWVGSGALKALVAEGCTGELNRSSKARFNGWSIHDLEAVSTQPHFDDEIVASIPEKLEAKYGGKLRTLCGDDDALIREHLMAFSDVRGTYGFLSRLLQLKNDPARARNYLDGVIELYKLPKTTTQEQAVSRLKTELHVAVERLKSALDKRNQKVVSVIQSLPEDEVAVVYGGIHAPGLLRLLESKGLGCTVVEPAGYHNNEAALMEQLEKAVKDLDKT